MTTAWFVILLYIAPDGTVLWNRGEQYFKPHRSEVECMNEGHTTAGQRLHLLDGAPANTRPAIVPKCLSLAYRWPHPERK